MTKQAWGLLRVCREQAGGGADVRWAEALLATGLPDHLAIEAGVEVDAEASRARAWAPGAGGAGRVGLGRAGGTTCSWAV